VYVLNLLARLVLINRVVICVYVYIYIYIYICDRYANRAKNIKNKPKINEGACRRCGVVVYVVCGV